MAFSLCFFYFFLPTEEDHHIHHGQKELVADESIVKVEGNLNYNINQRCNTSKISFRVSASDETLNVFIGESLQVMLTPKTEASLW
jgi:hypothetical protein